MIIERRPSTMSWRVSEGVWHFEIVEEVARVAYKSHLAFIVERDRLRAFSEPETSFPDVARYLPTRLPTWEEFLEMLARDKWERMRESGKVPDYVFPEGRLAGDGET